MEDRSKRELLTTITPERSDVRKKRLKSDGEQLKEKSPGKDNSKKTLFAESSTVSDSSEAESGIASFFSPVLPPLMGSPTELGEVLRYTYF